MTSNVRYLKNRDHLLAMDYIPTNVEFNELSLLEILLSHAQPLDKTHTHTLLDTTFFTHANLVFFTTERKQPPKKQKNNASHTVVSSHNVLRIF